MVCDTSSSQDAFTHQIWDSYLKLYKRCAPDTIILKTRSSSRSQWPNYGSLHILIPRCIIIPNLRCLAQIILEICSGHDYSKNFVRGQGHSDPKMVFDTPLFHKVGRSKPPPVLTSGFNRLKPSRSICQKVVNTGQYEPEWSIENSKGRFCGELRYLYRFYVLSTEKTKKNHTVLSLPRALFMQFSISIP